MATAVAGGGGLQPEPHELQGANPSSNTDAHDLAPSAGTRPAPKLPHLKSEAPSVASAALSAGSTNESAADVARAEATAGGLPVDIIPRVFPGNRDADAAAAEQLHEGGQLQRPSLQRKPTKAKDKIPVKPSRFSLRLTAEWWRGLQCIGMGLHFLASPQPPAPDFTRSVPSTLASKPGSFNLQFYCPKGYNGAPSSKSFPTVVNYHGGGFTLGHATDDARFARAIVEKCGAIFVSVEYRLAPEFPFPTAVDDGADALIWLIRNAVDLRINRQLLATSGFSAGANIALTAPMRLRQYLMDCQQQPCQDSNPIPRHAIVAIATWYPITDYTLSRDERRAMCKRPDQTLPPMLTNLFDAAYLFPPELDLANPCLSPSQAPDEMLAWGLPRHILFYTCEWDMLLKEGEELAMRLMEPSIGKQVQYHMIHSVPHGWDKGPNPVKPPPKSERLYAECCRRLRRIFDVAIKEEQGWDGASSL